MSDLVQSSHSSRATQVKVTALGIGGVTLAGLFASLLFGGQKHEGALPSTQPVAAVPVGEPERRDAVLASLQIPVVERTPVEQPPSLSDQPQTAELSDPCQREDAAELAANSFRESLRWLECENPEVGKLAEGFVSELTGRPASLLTDELKLALVDAANEKFSTSKESVLLELGDLKKRSPDAYTEIKSLPPDYQGTRFDVLEDKYGQRRAMIVVFNGSQGQAYAIPQTAAGKQFALDKIMMEQAEGTEPDPAWYELLLEPENQK